MVETDLPRTVQQRTSRTSRNASVTTEILENICQGRKIDDIFDQVLPIIGQQLQCDRVFVYVRSPYRGVGRVPFCWRKHRDLPLVYDADWKTEPCSLSEQDPMFAAALKAQPSLFIEDIETASPEVLNRDFEVQTFGHRALIHAHLCIERKLWGILQACIFDQPRHWNRGDYQLIERAVGWFTPLAMEYVHCHLSI